MKLILPTPFKQLIRMKKFPGKITINMDTLKSKKHRIWQKVEENLF